MIYYDTTRVWQVLLHMHGSALNGQAPVRAFIVALFALGVALANKYYPFVTPTARSIAFADTLSVFNTFLGLTISFRLNSAFNQWRSGIVAIGSLSEAARGIVASGCAYVSVTIDHNHSKDDAGSEKAPRSAITREILEKCAFITELRRLVFLYIAIVFHSCRGRDGIEKLKLSGVLTDAEYDELYACGAEQPKCITPKEAFDPLVGRTPHKLRATITELWLKRLIEVAGQRGHLSGSNAGALQAKVSQLPALYTTVYHIANVPIPFNYMQYLQILLLSYMTLYTFVIVSNSGLYTPLWVFVWGIFLFTADEVAMEIECPFGLDANDIDLEARLLQIEEELTVLIRSQYYFMTGGVNLSHLSGGAEAASSLRAPASSSSDQQESEGTDSEGKVRVAVDSLKDVFSFHQGRLSHAFSKLSEQDSLPEIGEFTALLQDSPIVRKSYGGA